MKVALTIAGSDSGGGAGIQADLKTFHAYGVFGTSAITAITAQNTLGVQAVHAVPVDIVQSQIRAVVSDLSPVACKSGMLATRAVVEAVAVSIGEAKLSNYVLDPVMVATRGDRLLDRDAEQSMLEYLVPLCTVVTPNLDEARILTGMAVDDEPAMHRAAEMLVRRGARAALVKGGHMVGDVLVDVLLDGDRVHAWRRPKLATRNTHGTGCTLSAAIAAGLALGHPLADAVASALDFVQRALVSAPRLGAGNGPLNHFIVPNGPPTSAAD